MSPKPNFKQLATFGVWVALLTWFVYVNSNAETFVVYVIAMALWISLFGYCVSSRGEKTETVITPPRQTILLSKGTPSLLPPLFAGLAIGAFSAGAVLYLAPLNLSGFNWTSLMSAASAQPTPRFTLCFTRRGANCVVDGGTFWNEGVKIRVVDIDAPETHPPRCIRESDLGRRATLRLQELLNEGTFQLETKGAAKDRNGRKLRLIVRGGQSLGLVLVNEGLARRRAISRQSWC